MTTRILAALAGIAALAAATSASAFGVGGLGSQSGDSWLNDAQKNPRFIEPYAQNDPARYRASNPREGWYDRQRASGRYGSQHSPSGY
jgi:hypothetical protein